MREAAGQLAHRLHLLRLAQRIFDPFTLGLFGQQPVVGVGQGVHVGFLRPQVGQHAA